MTQKLTAWSYSRYRDHKRCPFFAKCKHIDKLKEPGSPAMERGTKIHKLAEDYVKGKLRKLPAELALLKDRFEALRARKTAQAEEQWLIDSEFQALPALDKPFDSFNQSDWAAWRKIWLRVKTDLHDIEQESNTLMIVDYKTGKFRTFELESYEEQLEISAMAGLIRYPTVAQVMPQMWYVDEGTVYPRDEYPEIVYKATELPRLVKLWKQKTKPMFTDTQFKPKPNNKCQYCHFRKSNGGPCVY